MGPSHIINIIIPNLEKLVKQLDNQIEKDNLNIKIDKQKIFSDKGMSFVYNALKVKTYINIRNLQF